MLYCASARANYTLRVVHPKLTDAYAVQHGASMRWDPSSTAPLTSWAACWSSWADCLEMIAARNPGVADLIVTEMGQAEAGFHVAGASQAREQLVSAGFNAPHWRDLREGLRPPGQPVVGIPGHGWQHEATEAVHAVVFQHHHLATSLSVMSGVPFTCFLVSRELRIDSSPLLILRRLWLPLPLSSRNCLCGLPLDSRGHHRAARGYALESAAARVCREAGARVSTNVMIRDTDLLPADRPDTRRLEVVQLASSRMVSE